jgi:uncharacterized lipoprotein YmbA
MKRMKFGRMCFATVMLVVFAMMLTGCIGGSSKPSKFYLLRSLGGSQANNISTASDVNRVSVLIGPITLPAYLDRSQVVTLATGNELVVEEFNRWGESLQNSFYRVLLEDLSVLSNADLYAYDRNSSVSTDFQVVIDVTRFDSVPGGDACLTVFWAVIGKDKGSPVIKRKSVFHKAVPTTGIAGVVDALNQTLTQFSREIAAAIKSLQR